MVPVEIRFFARYSAQGKQLSHTISVEVLIVVLNPIAIGSFSVAVTVAFAIASTSLEVTSVDEKLPQIGEILGNWHKGITGKCAVVEHYPMNGRDHRAVLPEQDIRLAVVQLERSKFRQTMQMAKARVDQLFSKKDSY